MRNDAAVNVLAGGLAGSVETVLTYPLDLAKTRQQLTSGGASRPVPSVLADVWRQEGLAGLFRGLAAPLVSEVPRRSLKFTMNGFFQSRFGSSWPGQGLARDVAVASAAGAAAGASETLIHTPFEVAKIKMQAEAGHGGLLQTLQGILRSSGPLGLYVGIEAYALRQVVWNGAFFGLIGLGKALPGAGRGSPELRNFATGLIAGSVATCLNNPLDVAKSRIQFGGPGAPQQRRWSLAVVAEIARSEGPRGLCKGLPARLYRSAPGHGLLYMGFEFFSGLLRGHGGVR